MDAPSNKELINKSALKSKMKSNGFKIAGIIVGAFLVFLIGFAAGMRVGFHKIRFSNDFGKNYERNFMGPKSQGPMGMFRDFEGKEMRNPHGLAGEIISISGDSLVIKDKDNRENTVAVAENTAIKNGNDDIKITDLKSGDKIVVLGKPGDDGIIKADLIRILNDFQPDDQSGNNDKPGNGNPPMNNPQDNGPDNFPQNGNNTDNQQN